MAGPRVGLDAKVLGGPSIVELVIHSVLQMSCFVGECVLLVSQFNSTLKHPNNCRAFDQGNS